VDTISSDGLTALTQAIAALLPATPAPLTPTVLLNPTQILPAGLGGLVGIQDNPPGEILSRRITATAIITVKASDPAGLDTAVTGVVNSLLTADRATLLNSGILRLSLGPFGPEPVPPAPAQREINIEVLFEFLQLPAADQGIIQTIPLNLAIS
jgi:hypothetical protein